MVSKFNFLVKVTGAPRGMADSGLGQETCNGGTAVRPESKKAVNDHEGHADRTKSLT